MSNGNPKSNMRHGGRILVDQLAINGVEAVFQVPGESFLAALDGFYDHPEIRLVTCRQEGGASMAAEAYGKLSGKPGICFVTRAPGATNASCGVHVALQDSTPMILFVGQVPMGQRDREAFQETDYRAMFGPLAKWVAEIETTDRIPEYVHRAFHVAQSGRPGPVVLALPEDMLSATADVEDAPKAHAVQGQPSEAQIADIIDQLSAAKSPLIMVGGSIWSEEAGAAITAFATRSNIPLCASMRCQSHIDNREAIYCGDAGIGINPKLAQRIKDADCILVLGPRLGEMTSQAYSLFDIPNPKQRLIFVHPDANESGVVYHASTAIVASQDTMARALADKVAGPHDGQAAKQARADFDAFREPHETPGDVKMEQVVKTLNSLQDDDTLITTGAGNYTGWSNRYSQFTKYLSQVACTSGSMGYGVPAALAAKVRHPDRQVVCFAGDGCFMMNDQELATMVQEGCGLVILVVNNGQYGTIRMHQAMYYPGRISGTQFHNPDFVALAKAYGGDGRVVSQTAEFEDAFKWAHAEADSRNVPVLLELRVDSEALSTTLVTSAVEAKALG